jgi:hypothetical protein
MSQPTAPATVTLPVLGTVQRRWVFVGGAAVAVVVGYAYLARRRRQADVTYDPATGTPTSGGTYVNPNPGADGSSGPIDSTPDSIDTNDAWTRVVLTDLVGLGWDPQFAALALGKYLAGTPVTPEELQVIRTAWGLRGRPPQGAPEPLLAPTGPPATQPPAVEPTQPPSGPIKAVAYAGQVADDFINAQTAAHGTYWHQLVLWNPGIVGNITKSTDSRQRKFISTAEYIVKQ